MWLWAEFWPCLTPEFEPKPALKPDKLWFLTKTGIEAGKIKVSGPKPALKPEKFRKILKITTIHKTKTD